MPTVSASRTFTSPTGAPPKMKTGHILPKMKHKKERSASDLSQTVDPLQHASSKLANFQTRHHNTNNKSGFNTLPSRPPSGRLAHRPGKPNRGSGKEHRALR